MQASYTLPCGGSTRESVSGQSPAPARSVSCRHAFCPVVSSDRIESCRSTCEKHPFFCFTSCETDTSSNECKSCQAECQAACECSDFCTPLIKDAALCHEQGSQWEAVLA